MRCKYCNQEVTDGAAVCPHCGREQDLQLRDDSDNPAFEGPLGSSKPAFTWGILSAVFACTMFLSPLALIFGLIGLNRAGKFHRYTGRIYGRALVGKCLSIAGIVLGAVLSTVMIVLIATGALLGTGTFLSIR